MKATFPKKVTVKGISGISATIYRQNHTKGEAEYVSYTLAYNLLGQIKRKTFADLREAEQVGEEAIRRISEGQQAVLELTNAERDAYLRSKELLKQLNVDIETACREYVEARKVLNGARTLVEAARLFMKHHAKELPRITVPAAVEECLAQCRADGKSKARMHQLEQYLNGFAKDINIEVSELTSGLVSKYLTAMAASERTKKNARNVLGNRRTSESVVGHLMEFTGTAFSAGSGKALRWRK